MRSVWKYQFQIQNVHPDGDGEASYHLVRMKLWNWQNPRDPVFIKRAENQLRPVGIWEDVNLLGVARG